MSYNRKHVLYLLFAVLVTGGGVYFLISQQGKSPHSLQNVPHREDLRENVLKYDRLVLQNGATSDYELFAAIVRLAEQGDEKALAVAMENAGNKSVLIREGVVTALGWSAEEDHFSQLMELLKNDPSQKVRLKAIKALSHKNWSRNRKTLRHMADDNSLPLLEKAFVYLSLVRLENDPSQEDFYIRQVIEIARKSELPETTLLVRELSSVATKNPRYQDYIYDLVKTTKDDYLKSLTLRFVAQTKPKKLAGHLYGLHTQEGEKTRLAVVQVLKNVCPADRWKILREVLIQEKNNLVWRSAVSQLGQMSGSEADKVLSDLLGLEQLSNQQKQFLNDKFQAARRGPGQRFCKESSR